MYRRRLLPRLAVLLLVLVVFEYFGGSYFLHSLLGRGGSYWTKTEMNSPALPEEVRLALVDEAPIGESGPLHWHEVEPGLEVSELNVSWESKTRDVLYLSRIDPKRFRLSVQLDPSGSRKLEDWMKELGEARVVINGSYFGKDGRPATPTKIDDRWFGPKDYDAQHGVLGVQGDTIQIVDASKSDWRQMLARSDLGFVSFPLLLDSDGNTKAEGDGRWLANRSFVGIDQEQKLILGTTGKGFFSLKRFAGFLRKSPLHLVWALNLDGGPVACQGVRAGEFSRDFCGVWETRAEGEGIEVLKPGIQGRRWGLPIVLAVFPRS